MSLTVKILAERVHGKAVGAMDLKVNALLSLDEAHRRGISPLFRAGLLENAPTLPGAVIATEALAQRALDAGVKAAVVHPYPQVGLAKLIDIFYPEPASSPAIHSTAVVDADAVLHPTVAVGPSAVVEAGVSIGEQTVIGPCTVICRNTVIGKRVRIGPGAIIGYEGFGFIPTPEGPLKVRQVGRVIIEDDVEIGANACIDRGTLGATVVGAASKLDNLVQVGHNGRIGRHVLVAGQVGLAGSVTVADDALIGGNAGVADHVHIGKSARVAAKSGVIGDVPDNGIVAGYPAMDRVKWLRGVASMTRENKK